ncbi:hypothetical protein GCM10010363_49310 [Streptomyces omiyaensis]|nr:hypothetical protein [Streptomyces omiyaensis]GGY61953.1 hypothetical protein GCM10010363_49310 [Streptomyces omiyaensis]
MPPNRPPPVARSGGHRPARRERGHPDLEARRTNPENLLPGAKYVYKEHLSSAGQTFIHVGPDPGDLGWIFRVKGTRSPETDYPNFSGGIGNLRPTPDPFFEEGKTYVHRYSPYRKRIKIEAVRSGDPDAEVSGPVALVLLIVGDGKPFWRFPYATSSSTATTPVRELPGNGLSHS